MKKVVTFLVVSLALSFWAESTFAAKICLLDSFNSFWELKGGKIDKKTFTTKHIIPGVCVQPGYADVTATNLGTLVVSFYDSHDVTGTCGVVVWSAATNIFFSGSGRFDTLGDGSIDGVFSVTPVSCSVLPPTGPSKTVDPNHPAIRKP